MEFRAAPWSGATMDDVLAAAAEFLTEDPDPDSTAELGRVLAAARAGDAAAAADLAERFGPKLTFGTAGLRGKVEAGTSRMNRVVVQKATWGLGTYLLAQVPDAAARGVVVGFDGRYSSRTFAEDAAAVLAGLGIPAHVFLDPVPTPLCAYATTRLGAAAGVMVTASHNPPLDNGYKVYWGDGAQIVPPHDVGIAAAIDGSPRAPQIEKRAPPDAAAAGLRRVIGDDVERAYLDAIAAGALHRGGPPLRVVYTAMHGVGHRLVARALAQAGVHGVVDVTTQVDPDGAFRTVAFPNPEEKGALDRALAAAQEARADLVVANDPDADRLAVAVRHAGAWRQLSGNDVGALLGADAIAHADVGGREKLVITTIVSSTMLSRIARDMGAAYAETLTGFKWIANRAMAEEAQGRAFVFGFEEALGYSVGPLVRDKDGISAVVRIVELARALAGEGKTLVDRLHDLFVAHGLSHAAQWSVVLPGSAGLARMKEVMATLRAQPPADLDGAKIVRVLDLERQVDVQDGVERPAALPRSDVLAFYAADGARLIVRPSGTEPKIKLYLELVGRVARAADVPHAFGLLDEKARRIRQAAMATLGLA